jgi:hypothetical protein
MKFRFLLLVAFCVAFSSAVLAQDTYVDYNHALDFATYHTYAWGQQPNANEIKSPFLAQEAQSQIDTQLQSRGLKMVQENQTPDLIVVASGGLKQQTSYTAWGTGGWRFGGGMGSITPDVSTVGTLVVDLYSTNPKQLAWRGTAQGTLNQSNSEKNRQLVDKAVAKMFRKYPVPAPKR